MNRAHWPQRHRILMVIVFTLLALSLPVQQAQAGTDLVDATNPQVIVDTIKSYGTANLETNSDGNPMIRGDIHGVPYAVYFYSCFNNKNCQHIQFRSSWINNGKIKMSDMNEWNYTKLHGKAYLDRENDPIIEMPLVLHYGVAKKNLEAAIILWATIAREFKDKLAAL